MKEAFEVMQKAMMKTATDDPVMHEHYGDIFLKLSDKDNAREQWLKSLELDPTNQKLRERFKAAGFGNPDDLLKDVKPGKKDKN